MRGYYGFSAAEIASALNHLLALHHASYRDCDAVASFDGRKFARRAKRMGLVPTVTVPSRAGAEAPHARRPISAGGAEVRRGRERAPERFRQ